jgi:deoxyribonuclease-1-like protein
VQRMLSLATLGVLGGLVWMFLSGGGLKDLGEAAQQSGQPNGGWNQTAGTTGASTTTPAARPPAVPMGQPGAASAPAPLGGAGLTIKIASFNIRDFGEKKATDATVMNTLAAIVRRFDVVAIQEVSAQDQSFIPRFVALVNQPGRQYAYHVGPRVGNSTQKEQFAYLYDTRTIISSPAGVYTMGDPSNLLSREPYVASFATNTNPAQSFTFTLINVHTVPDSDSGLAGELEVLAEVYREVRRAGGNEDDVIMVGDFNFNVGDPRVGRLAMIPGIAPLIRDAFTNVAQSALYDNIVIHEPSTTEYAGTSGVLRFDQEAQIPPQFVGRVSDHFPVWAEFSFYELDHQRRFVNRGSLVR